MIEALRIIFDWKLFVVSILIPSISIVIVYPFIYLNAKKKKEVMRHGLQSSWHKLLSDNN